MRWSSVVQTLLENPWLSFFWPKCNSDLDSLTHPYLAKVAAKADILVVAIGRAKFVTPDFVKPGAVVIDVGMNRDENGKLCGDVDYEAVAPLASHITPVPGGVGPMTITMLMEQTYQAALRTLDRK